MLFVGVCFSSKVSSVVALVGGAHMWEGHTCGRGTHEQQPRILVLVRGGEGHKPMLHGHPRGGGGGGGLHRNIQWSRNLKGLYKISAAN